jgi:hypothetical protein
MNRSLRTSAGRTLSGQMSTAYSLVQHVTLSDLINDRGMEISCIAIRGNSSG